MALKKPSLSQVCGISASQDFWKEVDKQAEEACMTRSAVVVEACIQAWGVKLAPTQSVGRPRKKTVKK